MAQDNSKIRDDLERMANQASIPLSPNLGTVDVVLKQRLERLSGVAFDMAYVQDQLFAHHTTVILLRNEIHKGQDSVIRKLAAESLSIILAHVRMARELMDELTGAVTRASVGPKKLPSKEARLGRSKACRAFPWLELQQRHTALTAQIPF
jgi:hypothetical protein